MDGLVYRITTTKNWEFWTSVSVFISIFHPAMSILCQFHVSYRSPCHSYGKHKEPTEGVDGHPHVNLLSYLVVRGWSASGPMKLLAARWKIFWQFPRFRSTDLCRTALLVLCVGRFPRIYYLCRSECDSTAAGPGISFCPSCVDGSGCFRCGVVLTSIRLPLAHWLAVSGTPPVIVVLVCFGTTSCFQHCVTSSSCRHIFRVPKS